MAVEVATILLSPVRFITLALVLSRLLICRQPYPLIGVYYFCSYDLGGPRHLCAYCPLWAML